jgi:hypothetical protein
MLTEKMMRLTGILSLLIMSVFLMAFDKKGINTEQGFYSVDVQCAADPVMVGRNNMTVTINDAKSMKPIERKLIMEVIPWMAAHEHGSSDIAVVTYLGKGQYRLEGVNFTMPGDWEVYFKLRDGDKEDSAVLNVHVGR